jgi:hypothetical protein
MPGLLKGNRVLRRHAELWKGYFARGCFREESRSDQGDAGFCGSGLVRNR